MITDGEPQGEPEDLIRQAEQRIKDDEANKRVAFFAVGGECEYGPSKKHSCACTCQACWA